MMMSILAAVAAMFFLACGPAEANAAGEVRVDSPIGVFPKGSELKSPHFTGRVWLSMLVDEDKTFNSPIGNVTFEPGCRNSWHKHPGGQLLLVTGGQGYYQAKGTPIRLLRPGDVVKIAPGVEHWHGATPDSWFAHLAISTNPQDGPVQWLQPVTDEEYHSYQSGQAVPPRLSDAAVRNHEALLPGYSSPLSSTDPELVEIFGNFAFDEVLRHGALDPRTRSMVILASLIAMQSLNEYRILLEAALNAGVTPVEAKEVVYQAVPYVGMGQAFDFISATNEVLSARGVALPLEPQSTTSSETRHEKGLALQKSIFGERIERMYRESPPDQMHIQQYLSANCFGDYYTRTGLDIKTRELLTFALLVALGGVEPQLKGHIQGNLNVGTDKATLMHVVTQLLPYVGYPRTLNAIRCLNEVIPVQK